MGDNSKISWKPIPSAPRYEVNPLGEVRNSRGQPIKPIAHKDGHTYFFPRRGERLYIHRAVLETFVGPCPPEQECRHLDGVASRNVLENLKWGTKVENAQDKIHHGTQPRGERSGTAKLTEVQVLEIRGRVPGETLRSLAKEYGVSHTAIRRAANGIKWAHLKGSIQ